jgi:tetratricopeptide (TPR) repeat protein
MHPLHGTFVRALSLVAAALAAAGCATTRPPIAGEAVEAHVAPEEAIHDASRREARRAERHFTDGSLLEMRERHAEAIAEYRRALAIDSTRSAIYYAIGKSFRELNEVDSAIHYTRLALARSTTLTGHEQLADLLMVAGDVDGAIEQYEAMLVLDPNHLQSRYLLARLLQRREPERAVAHFEYILRNLTDDADVMLRLAELYLDAGNVDGAIGIMERMLALEPTSSELHQMMMTLLLDATRYGAALELLRAAETRVPVGPSLESFYLETLREADERLADERAIGDSLAAYARELVIRSAAATQTWNVRFAGGIVALTLGDSTRAEALFARALADSLATPEAWTQVAARYVDGDDPRTGLRIVSGSMGRFAGDYRIPYLYGLLHRAAGDADSAATWIRASIDLYEENAEAWESLARIYESQGKIGASDAAYEKSVDLDPDNPSVLNNFAFALARRGSRLDRALELVTRALDLEPQNESFLDTRGWVHYRRGELDAALEYISRAVAAGGADAEVYEHLGDVLKARGDYAGAREAYARARELDPTREGLSTRIESVR